MRNPKEYAVWNHRKWLLRTMPDPDWQFELKTVEGLLEKDARNCQCLYILPVRGTVHHSSKAVSADYDYDCEINRSWLGLSPLHCRIAADSPITT